MSDVKGLIASILSDEKLKKSDSFRSTVYQDEPILRTAGQLPNYTPPEIRRMRELANTPALRMRSVECQFYQQAKLLENYEDNFDYHGTFLSYFPTYQTMSLPQLRGYFTWRTQVRQGKLAPTSLSFVYVYLYELLNGIGVTDPEDGFRKLLRFWQAYRDIDASISRYLRVWLSDYLVYYNLPPDLLGEITDDHFDADLAVLLDAGNQEDDALFPALQALSSYGIERSKLFRQEADAVRQVCCDAFRKLSGYAAAHRKRGLCEKLFGRCLTCRYDLFHAAVFYDRMRYTDYAYVLTPFQRYTCQNGNWSCEKYYGSRGRSPALGAMLKTVDRLLRERLDIQPPLQAEAITKGDLRILEACVDSYLADRKAHAKPEIRIDLSKLGSIRQAAAITRDKLIVAEATEPEAAPAPMPQAPPPAEEAVAAATPLDETETAFLRCLLNGTPYAELLKAQNRMLSVLVDAINEALFDRFGDTVLLMEDAVPVLLEDYAEELKGMIGT